MKPYLAIIYDSFLEAAQSRVLWVLLVCWTIILGAISPFSIIEGTTFEIQSDQILDRPGLLDDLMRASEGKATAAQNAVWGAIEPSFQKVIIDRQKNPRSRPPSMGYLAEGLNSALDEKNLYDAKFWPTAAKRSELEGLLDGPGDQLSEKELERRNRRLIELAFPRAIRGGESNAIWIGYAGWKVTDALPISRKQVRPFFEGVILLVIFKIGISLFGTFVGIIVTSSMIPDLFQVGSLHLLLSKPISRSWLLVAKFIGGTCFISLNVTFLLVGFYFLVGWRLGFWNQGILWCIPLFVFVFMIYYSVSMLSGLIWRNAIVSIVITAMFWGICTTLGITYGVMDEIVKHDPEIVRLEQAGPALFGVTHVGDVFIWNAEKNQWERAFGQRFEEDSILGPYWIPHEKLMIFGRPRRMPFGAGFQSEDIRMQTVSFPELADEKSSTIKIEKISPPLWSDKRLDVFPAFPPRTRRITPWRDSIAILTDTGIRTLDFESVRASESQESLSWMQKMLGAVAVETYPSLTPGDWTPQPPMAFTTVPKEDQFLVYSRGRMIRLEETKNMRFEVTKDLDLGHTEGALALVAANDHLCLIAKNKGGIETIDVALSNKPQQLSGSQEIVPRSLAVSRTDGAFALLDNQKKLWRISADGNQLDELRIGMQESVSAVSIAEDGKWLIAHDVNRVSVWDPKSGTTTAIVVPKYSILDRVFYGIVQPLYYVNPKPAAVDTVVQQTLTDQNPFLLGRDTSELEFGRSIDDDPWLAIGSNAFFILTIMLIGCWYMYRQDL